MYSDMKIQSFLTLSASVAALPAAADVASRAVVSKTDGLKFNIDGVTKCESVLAPTTLALLTNGRLQRN